MKIIVCVKQVPLTAHLHVGEGELGVLELGNGLAELDAALGVLLGLVLWSPWAPLPRPPCSGS